MAESSETLLQECELQSVNNLQAALDFGRALTLAVTLPITSALTRMADQTQAMSDIKLSAVNARVAQCLAAIVAAASG